MSGKSTFAKESSPPLSHFGGHHEAQPQLSSPCLEAHTPRSLPAEELRLHQPLLQLEQQGEVERSCTHLTKIGRSEQKPLEA